MHFGHANGFSRLYHAFFGWGFILGCGAYEWSSFLGRHPGWFGHFVLMCSSLTFLFHMENTSSFILLIYFGRFQHINYAGMKGHYESKIMGVFSGPFKKVSSSTIDILWWYRPSFYRRLCPFCFSRELGFGGSVFVF
jgi:hypothetical protein